MGTRENNTLRTIDCLQETNKTLTDYLTKRLTILLQSETTARTLSRRGQIGCHSHDRLTDEIKHLNTVFKNNYITDFIAPNTCVRPNDSSNNSYITIATIPYIRGTSETIARILRPYNIRVAHKPIFTSRRLVTNVKDKDEPEDRPGEVYKIKCSDYQTTYIGETDRQ